MPTSRFELISQHDHEVFMEGCEIISNNTDVSSLDLELYYFVEKKVNDMYYKYSNVKPNTFNICAYCFNTIEDKRASLSCKKCNKVFYCKDLCKTLHQEFHDTDCRPVVKSSWSLFARNQAIKAPKLKTEAQKKSRHGLTGLHNLGNTCNLNVVI